MAREILDELIDILYPLNCLGCGGKGGAALCPDCLTRLRTRDRAVVVPGSAGPGRPSQFEEARAGGWYEGLLKELVLGLKGRGGPYLRPLALLMIAAAGNDPGYIGAEGIFFVPLTRRKASGRGFNQAELLARRLGKHLGVRVYDSLVKVRETRDQAELPAGERFSNVRDVYRLNGKSPAGKSVLLVDDVMTTGATAAACSGALKAAGAAEVRVLVAARTPGPGR